MKEHLHPLPVGRKVETATIRACIVIRLTDIWRIRFEGRAPGIADILVDSVAISIQFEESWYGEIHPLGVVVLQCEEILRRILMIFHETEFPHTLHRLITGRSRLVALCLVNVLEGKEIGTSWFTVLLVHTGVTPHGSRVSSIGRQ